MKPSAILTFALDVRIGWLDLDMVGWILMAAGVVGLVVTLSLRNRRTTVVADDPARSQRVVERTDLPSDQL